MIVENKTGYPSVEKPWLKFYSEKQIDFNLPKENMYEYMLRCTAKDPSKYVLNYFGNRVSYNEFISKIGIVSNSLLSYGIKRGDVVTLCILGIPENYYLFYAINKIGAIANYVAVNDTSEEMKKKILSVDSRMIFVINLVEKNLTEAVKENDIPIISIPIYESMPFLTKSFVKRKTINLASGDMRVVQWETFFRKGQRENDTNDAIVTDANTVALIEYTSGTTGESKGAVHKNLAANVIAMNYYNLGNMMEHRVGDRFLNCIPPFLAYGTFVGVHMPICLGMEVVLCPNPDAAEFVNAFKKYKPNHFAGGALHIDKMMQDARINRMDLSFLKTAAFGGDSVTDAWTDRVNAFLCQHGCKKYLARGYGMTEVAGTFATSNQIVREMIPFPTNNVMIRDVDTGEELQVNQEGEILISGPSMMLGYYANEDENKSAFIEAKGIVWLKTGDLGYVKSSGELVISGRLKRICWTLSKDGVGCRVYPMKIEQVIAQHENVEQVAVIGVKHPDRGYLSIAYIKLKDMRQKMETVKDIEEMCEKNLNDNFIPAEYRFIDEMPTTKAGKIDYEKLHILLPE